MRRLAASVLLCLLALAPVRASAQPSWANRLVGPRARAELSSPSAEVRLAAVQRLARRGEPRQSVRALLDLLESEEDLRVRDAVYDALARRGDPVAIDAMAARLGDREAAGGIDDRARALRAIGAIGTDRAIRILVEWIGRADVGEVAAEALSRIGPSAVPHLVRALATPIATARAATVLGRIGDARATAPLIGRLRGALPASRIAIIDALAEIGDERAGRAVARYLDDADPNVVASTLRALAALGGADQAEAVAALADRGTAEQRAAALRTLLVIAPALAAPRVQAVVDDRDAPPLVRRAAIDGVLAGPAPEMVDALRVLLRSELAMHAAEALARVERGLGLPALLEAARQSESGAFDPALALAVRRYASADLPGPVAEALDDHLAAARPVVRCLARRRDAALEETLRAGLEDEDPAARARAASCALLLGAGAAPLADDLVAALVAEQAPMAFRMIALCILRLDAPVDPARLDARWWDPDTAPEALWIAAANLHRTAPRTRARARRAMRRGLRSAEPRARAGAALALAMASERQAWRALLAALDDEHDTVRIAAARALASLASPDAVEDIEAASRVEPTDAVRRALRLAARAPSARPVPAHVPGDDVLFVRVSTAPGLQEVETQLAVDVVLADGRWLRVPALDDGAVLLPDVPAGLAEVQVRLDR